MNNSNSDTNMLLWILILSGPCSAPISPVFGIVLITLVLAAGAIWATWWVLSRVVTAFVRHWHATGILK